MHVKRAKHGGTSLLKTLTIDAMKKLNLQPKKDVVGNTYSGVYQTLSPSYWAIDGL
jgi:hypothetical protein